MSPAMAQVSGSTEKEAFEAAKELGTVEAWDAFLSNYPTGFHADLARAYVKKLAAPAAPAAAAPTPAAPPPAVPADTVAPLEPAQELSCQEAANVRSQQSAEPAKIRFVNESGATRIIQWIDFNGALKEYAVLAPGQELTQETFLTHPWVAAYQEGSCRQLFLPGKGLTIARLLPGVQGKAPTGDGSDHGPTPEQTCRNIGQDYNGRECVPRKVVKPAARPVVKPSKATIERRARANCLGIGMAYINGKCAPKTKAERKQAAKNKNKACPAGMYRNPYGQCQPNETGG